MELKGRRKKKTTENRIVKCTAAGGQKKKVPTPSLPLQGLPGEAQLGEEVREKKKGGKSGKVCPRKTVLTAAISDRKGRGNS